MQFTLKGKIVKRTVRKVTKKDKTSYDLYQVVIEEPGIYPSRFQVGTKDPSLFGASDGPFAIGKFATVTGFINGVEREVQRKDGSGTFMSYSTWLTAKTIETATAMESNSISQTADDDDSEIPF